MKRAPVLLITLFVLTAGFTFADTFGTGANKFKIDFVKISGGPTPNSGYGVVGRDYRIGTYEISNDQWNKFKAVYGTVTGNPLTAYDYSNPSWAGPNLPANGVSWFEAAQFVNYLNTSKGYQAAYKFTGTKGTSSYTYVPWNNTDQGYMADNPYRNSNAFYFLPTEHEWVRAAYWNGTAMQTYSIKAGTTLFQGNGSNGGWNYGYYTTNTHTLWSVGSSSQELNGTFNMMGNVWEWVEGLYGDGSYLADSKRALRGGSCGSTPNILMSSYRYPGAPDIEGVVGFRVASVPEPASLILVGLGGLALRRRHLPKS